jgi:hypothetical protein
VEKFLNWGLEKQGLNCSRRPSITPTADGTSILENPLAEPKLI